MATINSSSAFLHQRAERGNKYTSGRLLIDAGSTQFPGAAVLAVGGARRGGAGYINYRSREKLPTELVLHAYPDVVPVTDDEIDDKFDAILIGPGSPAITSLPRARRLIVDGGALSFIEKPAHDDEIWILTPHEGEIKKMGFDPSDRKSCAIDAARSLHVILLLKGFHSIIATPSGIVHIDEIGGSELSTAGTGDVLAGLISSMIASHKPESIDKAAEITAHAVEIFSNAAQSSVRKKRPLVATDLIEEIPRLLAQGETFL